MWMVLSEICHSPIAESSVIHDLNFLNYKKQLHHATYENQFYIKLQKINFMYQVSCWEKK